MTTEQLFDQILMQLKEESKQIKEGDLLAMNSIKNCCDRLKEANYRHSDYIKKIQIETVS